MPFPIEYALFAATLLGVAVLHGRAFTVAFVGLGAIALYKLFGPGFPDGAGLDGLTRHLAHEAATVSNLFLLITGFSVLSKHFEDSGAPEALPNILPDDWRGGAALLGLTFVLSAFLDNIAAALIGAAAARHVFQGKVSVGYLAAIVAASNAGGSGSVVGDTTTTMMWIDGVSPLQVLPAYVAAGTALCVIAVPAALAQQRVAPIVKARSGVVIDWARIGVVGAVLSAAIAANVLVNSYAPALAQAWPALGLTVWAALLALHPLRRAHFGVVPDAAKGALFLCALVMSASLMPIEALPAPSTGSTLALGFVSAVFDNIPLTALALNQGGYDWAMLAFAVGYGGSMIWFGSSAGVAVAGMHPEARSVWRWLREGWFVPVGYVVGFAVYVAAIGWSP